MRISRVKESDILSQTSSHALGALAILARLGPDEHADAKVIAARIGAPPNYLAKLLGQLAKEGVVVAKKGAGGGFRLGMPASRLSLYEALSPIERMLTDKDCVLGGRRCDRKAPCALHDRWSGIRAEILDMLKRTTLAAFAGGEGE